MKRQCLQQEKIVGVCAFAERGVHYYKQVIEQGFRAMEGW